MTSPALDQRIAVDVREAAELVSVSRATIQRALDATDPALHLPSKRIGTRRVIVVDDLREWIASRPDA